MRRQLVPCTCMTSYVLWLAFERCSKIATFRRSCSGTGARHLQAGVRPLPGHHDGAVPLGLGVQGYESSMQSFPHVCDGSGIARGACGGTTSAWCSSSSRTTAGAGPRSWATVIGEANEVTNSVRPSAYWLLTDSPIQDAVGLSGAVRSCRRASWAFRRSTTGT